MKDEALVARLTALADDELILAHRNSEWTGHAPMLEEDIALANLAQDELGHATVWFKILETITEKSADQMAFFRPADGFCNAQFLELPRGDWAFTMLRQYLFDVYETVLLPELAQSTYTPIAEGAAKMIAEEMYHLRHSHLWAEMLGLGTAESHARGQDALDTLWSMTNQLFKQMEGDETLIESGYFPDVAKLRDKFRAIAVPHLTETCGFTLKEGDFDAGRTEHTAHLTELLEDMQKVARWEPEGEW